VRLVPNCLSEEEFGLAERIALNCAFSWRIVVCFPKNFGERSILVFSKRPMAAVSDSFILPHTKSCT
jgi:hypothetical protein